MSWIEEKILKLEKTLEYDLIKDSFFKEKNYNNLNRLIEWKQLQSQDLLLQGSVRVLF